MELAQAKAELTTLLAQKQDISLPSYELFPGQPRFVTVSNSSKAFIRHYAAVVGGLMADDEQVTGGSDTVSASAMRAVQQGLTIIENTSFDSVCNDHRRALYRAIEGAQSICEWIDRKIAQSPDRVTMPHDHCVFMDELRNSCLINRPVMQKICDALLNFSTAIGAASTIKTVSAELIASPKLWTTDRVAYAKSNAGFLG